MCTLKVQLGASSFAAGEFRESQVVTQMNCSSFSTCGWVSRLKLSNISLSPFSNRTRFGLVGLAAEDGGFVLAAVSLAPLAAEAAAGDAAAPCADTSAIAQWLCLMKMKVWLSDE